jgi:hypothetical protein
MTWTRHANKPHLGMGSRAGNIYIYIYIYIYILVLNGYNAEHVDEEALFVIKLQWFGWSVLCGRVCLVVPLTRVFGLCVCPVFSGRLFVSLLRCVLCCCRGPCVVLFLSICLSLG